MRRIFPFLVLVLLLGGRASAQNQNSNGLPFTGVTPPPAPVLTSLTGLTATGKIYTGAKMPVIGTGFASNCVVNVDGTAQAASTFVFVSSTEIDFTIPATDSGAHTITVSCPNPVLTLNSPVTLPNVMVGQNYSVSLPQITSLSGGVPPYTWTLSSGALPTGLNLSVSGIVAGTPSGAGSFNFQATVKDSSSIPTFSLALKAAQVFYIGG